MIVVLLGLMLWRRKRLVISLKISREKPGSSNTASIELSRIPKIFDGECEDVEALEDVSMRTRRMHLGRTANGHFGLEGKLNPAPRHHED